jgi:hypothetical protein
MTDDKDRDGASEPGDLGRLFLRRAGAGDVDGVRLCEPMTGAATDAFPVAGEQRHE